MPGDDVRQQTPRPVGPSAAGAFGARRRMIDPSCLRLAVGIREGTPDHLLELGGVFPLIVQKASHPTPIACSESGGEVAGEFGHRAEVILQSVPLVKGAAGQAVGEIFHRHFLPHNPSFVVRADYSSKVGDQDSFESENRSKCGRRDRTWQAFTTPDGWARSPGGGPRRALPHRLASAARRLGPRPAGRNRRRGGSFISRRERPCGVEWVRFRPTPPRRGVRPPRRRAGGAADRRTDGGRRELGRDIRLEHSVRFDRPGSRGAGLAGARLRGSGRTGPAPGRSERPGRSFPDGGSGGPPGRQQSCIANITQGVKDRASQLVTSGRTVARYRRARVQPIEAGAIRLSRRGRRELRLTARATTDGASYG